MAFGGTTDPCASIQVTSIGKLGVEENKAISKVVFDLIQTKLQIPDDRLAIIHSHNVCICIHMVLFYACSFTLITGLTLHSLINLSMK